MSAAAVLCGIGAWLPPDVVTNDDLAARLDTSDEWIRSRTGIRRRHVVAPGTATSDLAVEAAARALRSAGLTGVDALVLATTTPDRPCPATAPVVAARLGLAGVPAFDVAAVCSGFLYAAATAAGLISTGVAGTVLVVGAEAFSTILDPADRSTAVIFGDGAGAVVLRAGTAGEPGAFGAFDLGADGALADVITVRAGGSRQRSTGPEFPAADAYFSMRGRDVFGPAVHRMAGSARAVLAAAGWRVEDLDWLVGHQANLRILHATAEQLDLPAERVAVHLDVAGNTAAASIPLALHHAAGTGRLTAGHKVALTAFGGGATWGATTLVWPDIHTDRPTERHTP